MEFCVLFSWTLVYKFIILKLLKNYIYIYSPISNKEVTRLRVDIVVWRKKIMNPKSVVWENFQGLEALLCFQGILDFTVNNFYPF